MYKYLETQLSISEDDKMTIIAKASVEVVDRDGEVIKIDGINTSAYQKNPVVLADHREDSILYNIGRTVEFERKNGIFWAKIKLNPDSTLAQNIFNNLRDGGTYMLSVGIEGIEARKPKPFELEQYPGCKAIIGKCRLKEISIVNIGANTEAVVEAVSLKTAAEAPVVQAEVPTIQAPITVEPPKVDVPQEVKPQEVKPQVIEQAVEHKQVEHKQVEHKPIEPKKIVLTMTENEIRNMVRNVMLSKRYRVKNTI